MELQAKGPGSAQAQRQQRACCKVYPRKQQALDGGGSEGTEQVKKQEAVIWVTERLFCPSAAWRL